MPNQFPEFERPPLDEVAIGVQFEPLKEFHAAHLGLYWSRIRAKYPLTEDQAPLAHLVESAEPRPVPPGGLVSFQSFPPVPRCWFLDKSKNQLIQVQQDRFLRNWRQLEGTDPYPRYSYLAQEFKQEWEGFLAFVHDEQLGQPSANQCELTYVNNINGRESWRDFSEVAKLFSLLKEPKESKFLPTPEMLGWETRYKLPGGRGRLHVQMNPAFRSRDLKLTLSLTLTARGAPAGGSPDQIMAWFDLAHEWVVNAFNDLTEPELHEIWKKKS
jgi:uncharacterized protein (TIGR04255 family)